MPGAMVPAGCKAQLLAQFSSLDEAEPFEVQEQGLAEGTQLLAKLVLESKPSADTLGELNQDLKSRGVIPWQGYQDIVFMHPTEPAFYVAWTKGSPFWGWILAAIGLLVLPPLLGGFIWSILPETIQQMIMMMIMLPLMMIMISAMGDNEKPKRKEVGGKT